MTELRVKKSIKNKVKSFLVIAACTLFSMGILAIPKMDMSAKVISADDPIAVENPCGEDGVKEIIHGERKSFLGCWGSDTTCKTKCN